MAVKKTIGVILGVLVLLLGVPVLAAPGEPTLILSHVDCRNGVLEVHFLVQNVPDGVTPGDVTYWYRFDPAQPGFVYQRTITTEGQTGVAWHYRDYPGDGYYEIVAATVEIGGVTYFLHNPSQYAGDYTCDEAEPTPTETKVVGEEPPTPTATLDAPDDPIPPTAKPTVEVVTPTPTLEAPTALDPTGEPEGGGLLRYFFALVFG
jgi:hypothetical protein